MADDLPTTIIQAAGQAATVRVGTVTSVSPLQISLNGTALNMDAVGVLGGGFTVGGPALLLGQSVQGAGTSGSTWCALGAPFPASVPVRKALIYQNEARASGTFDFGIPAVVPPMSFSVPLAPGVYDFHGMLTIDAELGVASAISGIGQFVLSGVAQAGQLIIVPRTALVRNTISSFWLGSFTLAVPTTVTVSALVTRVNGANGQLTGQATHSKIGIQIFR